MQKFDVGLVIEIDSKRLDAIVTVEAKDRYDAIVRAGALVLNSTEIQLVIKT